jgi:hypothetical protein
LNQSEFWQTPVGRGLLVPRANALHRCKTDLRHSVYLPGSDKK